MIADTNFFPSSRLNPFIFIWLLSSLILKAEMVHSAPPPKHKLLTVVIDPGHGGHDSGCQGSSSYEKNIALAVSLQLGKLIELNFPDVKVIYTRKTDVFVELHRRAQIANENKADLFICIHCNSGPKSAFGAETYVMGLHKTDNNLQVARRENAVILKEENYENKYDGFDPNSPEANIIFSLYQNAFLTQSLFFADRLQHEFLKTAGRFNRGVKQAGFLVLYRTTMPSVLIETGFLTNPEEEKFLFTGKGQNKMAFSILKAFFHYKNWLEENPEIRENLKVPDNFLEETAENQAKSKNMQGIVKMEDKTVALKNNEIKTPDSTKNNSTIFFRIQIISSPERIPLNSNVFKGKENVFEYFANNSFKYTIGNYDKMEDAIKLQAEIKKSGYPDAFIVPFKNNQRISLQEALSNQ